MLAAPDGLLASLAARRSIGEPVVLLAAHPDDEVIGAGGLLSLFHRLVLVHVTDGAPRNGEDARAHGFEGTQAYAAARQAELSDALRALGSDPARGQLDSPDQGSAERLLPLARQLRAVVQRHGAVAILTHPYEGGHPDHDSAAFIAAQCGVPVLEFASYHAGPGGAMTVGAFLPGPEPLRIVLSPAERARKRAALDCFRSQAATLAPFGTEAESFRAAPAYDFRHPPHPGTLHYERYDWGMTGERWRAHAATAAAVLC